MVFDSWQLAIDDIILSLEDDLEMVQISTSWLILPIPRPLIYIYIYIYIYILKPKYSMNEKRSMNVIKISYLKKTKIYSDK